MASRFDDDDEVMKFEVTEEDLAEEAGGFMGAGRGRGRQSKEQALYGVWAESSDEDERPTMGGGSKGKQRDFTAPINFVSGGVANKKKEGGEEEDEKDERIGSGESSDDDDRHQYSAGRHIKAGGLRGPAGMVQSEGQFAGQRSHGYRAPQSLGKGFGEWEKHTKGIGASLLLKMGYQPGKGLGKNQEGRVEIVEAYLRKKGAGVGAAGPEGGRPKKVDKKTGKLKGDSDDEEERNFREKLNQWKQEPGGKKKNVSYVYKSVEEVLQEGQHRKVDRGRGKAGEQVKVIDMTGREQRVMTGYSAIAGQQRPGEEGDIMAPLAKLQEKRKANFELPELLHNLDLLVDMCEQDIIAADRKLAHHRDRVQVLEREGEKMSDLVEQEKKQIKAMEEILVVLDTLEENHHRGSLDQETAVRAFTRLKEEFPKEFKTFELSYCAQTVVVPLVKESLEGWSPLAGRNHSLPHLTTFTQWREILECGPDHQNSADAPMQAYHSLVWEAWLPQVRLAVQRWQSRQPEPLVAFLELWRPLVPPWVMQHVLEQLVLVRLQAEVELWNPLTDTSPIHTWLHPWLPPLGSRLEIVFPTIRNKLSSALSSWVPTDRSAKLILLPWKEVFSRPSMSAFLTKNIVPKLEAALATMVISPQDQDLTLWKSVTDWADLLPAPQLAATLAQSFFPRWLQVLAAWLNATPNYSEVVGWYQGWKSVIPPEVLPLPEVADHLSQALHMMNRSVTGSGPLAAQPGALENVRYMTGREMPAMGKQTTTTTGAQPPAPGTDVGNQNKFDSMSEAVKTSAAIPQGFKDLIGKR